MSAECVTETDVCPDRILGSEWDLGSKYKTYVEVSRSNLTISATQLALYQNTDLAQRLQSSLVSCGELLVRLFVYQTSTAGVESI